MLCCIQSIQFHQVALPSFVACCVLACWLPSSPPTLRPHTLATHPSGSPLLQDPEYIAVHSEASAPTPLKLQQAYMECELQQKMDILWSFIKTHLKVGGGAVHGVPVQCGRVQGPTTAVCV